VTLHLSFYCTTIFYMTNHGYRLNQSVLKLISQMSFILLAELDSPDAKVMNASRIIRVARGSGHTLQDVHELLNMYKQTCKAVKPMSKMLQKNVDLTQINKLLPTSMLSQLGGREALQSMANKFRQPQK
jgi:signal recognition particle subunit SRP54